MGIPDIEPILGPGSDDGVGTGVFRTLDTLAADDIGLGPIPSRSSRRVNRSQCVPAILGVASTLSCQCRNGCVRFLRLKFECGRSSHCSTDHRTRPSRDGGSRAAAWRNRLPRLRGAFSSCAGQPSRSVFWKLLEREAPQPEKLLRSGSKDDKPGAASYTALKTFAAVPVQPPPPASTAIGCAAISRTTAASACGFVQSPGPPGRHAF